MEKKALFYGIIHIGSSNLSLRIVEYKNIDNINVIEEVKKHITFGEEVFHNGKLSFDSILELCKMLKGLKQLLSDYQVKVYSVYATSLLREAENKRAIIDLIRVHTGFRVQVLDMPQEIYFKHFALQHILRVSNSKKLYSPNFNFLFIDITSGCIGLTVWENGVLRYQHNIHIGTLRLLEAFSVNQRDSQDFSIAIEEYIHAIMTPLWKFVLQYNPEYVVFSGSESRIMTEFLELKMNVDNMVSFKSSDFYKSYTKLNHFVFNKSKNISKYGIFWKYGVLPTIYLYKEILENIKTDKILIMGTTFIEAVAMFYGAEKTNDSVLSNMRTQNLELTRSIASCYFYEHEHAKIMESFCFTILNELKKKNGLTNRDEFLLRMSIILYQIGKFVNLLDSYKQGWNLIRSTDVFGISEKEKDIVACIVYYAQGVFPHEKETPFALLTDSAKMTALKLIAIFRMILAMDISRKQKLKNMTVKIDSDKLVINYDSYQNTSLEEWIFEKEKEFFQNIFGIEARLERR